MTENDINGWHIREIGGEERKWPKEDREGAIEDYEEFAGRDFVGSIEVVDPEGGVVKSENEQTQKEVKPDTNESPPSMGKDGKPKKTRATHPGEFDNSQEPVIETTAEGGQPVVDKQQTTNGGGESDINALAKNPIEWLNTKNSEYVNVIRGKDAISKRGFRYIQSQFGISTESEIIEVLDDPLGVIVWAKAELPEGRHAEAHGEGYRFENGVDDNEFVRYADTRAKSRALADLTASGALATEEMKGQKE